MNFFSLVNSIGLSIALNTVIYLFIIQLTSKPLLDNLNKESFLLQNKLSLSFSKRDFSKRDYKYINFQIKNITNKPFYIISPKEKESSLIETSPNILETNKEYIEPSLEEQPFSGNFFKQSPNSAQSLIIF